MNNKYIKKSVEIEAIQWNGNNLEEIMKFLDSEFKYERNNIYHTRKFTYDGEDLFIVTLEGVMKATIGDYIIKGIKGEYYPCKHDIFELTYEKVYTLEEVKKMWEEDGWKVSEDGYFNTITFITDEKGVDFDIKDKTYFTFQKELEHNSFDIDYKLHDLITKTIKALEKEEK